MSGDEPVCTRRPRPGRHRAGRGNLGRSSAVLGVTLGPAWKTGTVEQAGGHRGHFRGVTARAGWEVRVQPQACLSGLLGSRAEDPQSALAPAQRKRAVLCNLKGPEVESGFRDGWARPSVGAWFLGPPLPCLPCWLQSGASWAPGHGMHLQAAQPPPFGSQATREDPAEGSVCRANWRGCRPELVVGTGKAVSSGVRLGAQPPPLRDGGRGTFTGARVQERRVCRRKLRHSLWVSADGEESAVLTGSS